MLLTITTTHRPATDLGYLLHKHPDRAFTFPTTFGEVRVFYPEAADDRCTAALLLEVDPVRLVRGPAALAQEYVNDRPYAASSFLSVGIAEAFGTALNGRSRERPDLAETAIPLEATLPVVPSRGGEPFLRALFEPLGYAVTCRRLPLDDRFPEWGPSGYYALTLVGNVRVADLLAHLYVLIPVLDDDKHYWVGEAEVEKLLKRGAGWLEQHPAREQIARRYLKHRGHLVKSALAAFADDPPAAPAADPLPEPVKVSLHQQRLDAVRECLLASGARRVLDLGCGEGRLLSLLRRDRQFIEIVGVDASSRALEVAGERLARGTGIVPRLLHGALTYRDRRLEGFDAAAVVEVVEHLDPPRLAAFERSVFAAARPGTVVVTTPNREYNRLFPGLAPGALRHSDHRFEWTRPEFAEWAARVALTHGYEAVVRPVGPVDDECGAPSQLALFSRPGDARADAGDP